MGTSIPHYDRMTALSHPHDYEFVRKARYRLIQMKYSVIVASAVTIPGELCGTGRCVCVRLWADNLITTPFLSHRNVKPGQLELIKKH